VTPHVMSMIQMKRY